MNNLRQAISACMMIALGTFALSSTAEEGGFVPLSSAPESLYVFGDYLYCSAEDGVHGRELWRVSIPEGKPELVADITPGERGSTIERFFTFKGKLYFRVADRDHGGELWWSDGEPTGVTERIARFEEGVDRYGMRSFLGEVGGKLFFTVGNSHSWNNIYTADGTRSGIVPFLLEGGRNLSTGGIDGVRSGPYLFFDGGGDLGGDRCEGFWRTDGTSAGTIFLSSSTVPVGGFQAMGSKGVFFVAKTDAEGAEPWFSGGTPESTLLLRDIWEGEESSNPSDPAYLEVLSHPDRSRAFFRASHPDYGDELWETDGTPEGTKLAFDLVEGRGSSSPYKLTAFANCIFYNARTDEKGTELWRLSPGSPWATHRVTDVNPGYLSSNPYAYAQAQKEDRIVFSAASDYGEELWVSDGNEDSTKLLADIVGGPESSDPYHSINIGGWVAFTAFDPVHGKELWITNGDSETRRWCDIYTDDSENPSSSPELLTPLGDRLLFVADDVKHGLELWVTDGEASGTHLLMDVYPGPAGSQPTELTAVGDLAYFAAEAPETGVELYVTDGTVSGTALAMDIHPLAPSSGPKHLFGWRGNLIFSASRPYDGEEPWIVRPGRKPDILQNIRADGASSNPRNFAAWKEHVYFLADDGIHGEELWRTDGSKEGTVLFKDVVSVPYETLSYQMIQPNGEKLYLSLTTPSYGRKLWVMDGESGPPRLVERTTSRHRIRALGK